MKQLFIQVQILVKKKTKRIQVETLISTLFHSFVSSGEKKVDFSSECPQAYCILSSPVYAIAFRRSPHAMCAPAAMSSNTISHLLVYYLHGKFECNSNFHGSGASNVFALAFIPTKDVVTPAPESESEYDSRPFSTPDSGTSSFGLESLESVP